jgi:Uma2 family endonuclease
MTDQVQTQPITLDDLMAMRERVEIINGEIVEMAAAELLHNIIGGNTYDVLKPFVNEKQLGAIFYDGLTYLMYSPSGGLKDSFVPDISFIRNENIPADLDISKPHPGVPDLAIEIVSPGDDPDDLQTKRKTYLAKGTEQVWIIYPQTREVHQFRRDNNPEIRIYKEGETLDCEALFPGLVLTTDMIFKLPAWATK